MAAIFAAVGLVIGFIDPDSIDAGEGPLDVATIGGFVGLMSGACFGTLLSFAESRRSILSLSLGRAALWGMLGSSAFPLLTGRADQAFFLCPIGAAIAVASVSIARRTARMDMGQPTRLRWQPILDVMAIEEKQASSSAADSVATLLRTAESPHRHGDDLVRPVQDRDSDSGQALLRASTSEDEEKLEQRT